MSSCLRPERDDDLSRLNRPEVNNAYDAGLINGVLAAMDDLGKKPSLRVVVVKGNGKHLVHLPPVKSFETITRAASPIAAGVALIRPA